MWFVKKNVFVVISQALSHGTSSSSTRMRISSGIASVGCVCENQSLSVYAREKRMWEAHIVQLNRDIYGAG